VHLREHDVADPKIIGFARVGSGRRGHRNP
jgi:hypothetical protein